jgi:hypothetical protein
MVLGHNFTTRPTQISLSETDVLSVKKIVVVQAKSSQIREDEVCMS